MSTKDLEEIIERAVTKQTEYLRNTITTLTTEIGELKQMVQLLTKNEVCHNNPEKKNKGQEPMKPLRG